MRKHALITGLARTGTTFLIAFYGRLGFDIGYTSSKISRIMDKSHPIHGGLELLNNHMWVPRSEASKEKLSRIEVIKHPWVYAAKKQPWHYIQSNKLTFDYIVLTHRDPDSLANSTAHAKVTRGKIKEKNFNKIREKALKAAPIKAQALREWAEGTNSSIITVEFPRSIDDFNYLWGQLVPSMREIKKSYARKV